MSTSPKIKRPALRYHGGKWLLGPWIISHFTVHRTYVEPFGGGASVLLRKARCFAEVYNDLDGEIVNLFRVIRDSGPELCQALMLTPFARDEFELTYFHSENPVEQARRTVLRASAGFGSNFLRPKKNGTGIVRTGFRANTSRSGTTPAHNFNGGMNLEMARRTLVRAFQGTANGAATMKSTGFKANTARARAVEWCGMAENLAKVTARLSGVVIENRPAMQVMAAHDRPDTLHYVDPPYPHSTRNAGHDYRHEMTDEQHRELAAFLRGLKGAVVLSGYTCPLYDELFADWQRHEKKTFADGARPRVEVLWVKGAKS